MCTASSSRGDTSDCYIGDVFNFYIRSSSSNGFRVAIRVMYFQLNRTVIFSNSRKKTLQAKGESENVYSVYFNIKFSV